MLFHNGMTRCFRPFPLIRTVRDGLSVTSARRRPIVSETRAPVLYIRANRTRSRWPLQVDSRGATRIAAISSRDRYPRSGRWYRFIGMARTRWTAGKQVGSRAAAYFRNERKAARRTFRVRMELPRCCSKYSRNARTAGASRSARVRAVKGRPRHSAKKDSSRRNISRYDATVWALAFCWAMSRWQKNSRTNAAKPGMITLELMRDLQYRRR